MEAIIIALTYLSPSDIRNPLLVNLGDRRLRQIAHKKVFREVRVGSEPYDASDCTKAIDTSAAGKVGGVLVSRVAIVLYLISAVGKTGGGFTHFTGSRGHIRIRPRHEHGGTFFFFPHTSTFQLLDKQWSQVSSLLSPGSSLPIRNAHRFQQSHCSPIFHRVLLTHALTLSASEFVHKKESPRIYTSMHSGGLKLTKVTYTRLEDNLIRHRGDR